MTISQNSITDMHGNVVQKTDLPSGANTRWTPNRKYIVLQAIKIGWVTESECLALYNMTQDELNQWKDAVAGHGPRGLKVTLSAEILEQKRLD